MVNFGTTAMAIIIAEERKRRIATQELETIKEVSSEKVEPVVSITPKKPWWKRIFK